MYNYWKMRLQDSNFLHFLFFLNFDHLTICILQLFESYRILDAPSELFPWLNETHNFLPSKFHWSFYWPGRLFLWLHLTAKMFILLKLKLIFNKMMLILHVHYNWSHDVFLWSFLVPNCSNLHTKNKSVTYP